MNTKKAQGKGDAEKDDDEGFHKGKDTRKIGEKKENIVIVNVYRPSPAPGGGEEAARSEISGQKV